MKIKDIEVANILLKDLEAYKRKKWMIKFGENSITMSFGNYPEQITISYLDNPLKNKIIDILNEYYTSQIDRLQKKIEKL